MRLSKLAVVVAASLLSYSSANAALIVSNSLQIADFDREATFDGVQNGTSLSGYLEDGIVFSSSGVAAGIGGPNPFNGSDLGATIASGGVLATEVPSRFEIELINGDEFEAFSFVFGRLSPQSETIQSVLTIQTFLNGVMTNERFLFPFPSEFVRVIGVGEVFDRIVLFANGLTGPDDNHSFAIDNFRINTGGDAPVVPAPPAIALFLTGLALLSRRRLSKSVVASQAVFETP